MKKFSQEFCFFRWCYSNKNLFKSLKRFRIFQDVILLKNLFENLFMLSTNGGIATELQKENRNPQKCSF